MSHRAKNRHKPRHHTHAVKPASLPPVVSDQDAQEAAAPAPDLASPVEAQAKESAEVVA